LKSSSKPSPTFSALFFKALQDVPDARDPKRITYPLNSLFFIGIFMFLSRLGARRQIRFRLDGSEVADKMRDLFGVETVPHGDTLDYAFSRLNPDHVQDVVSGIPEGLIRRKVLETYRLLDKYYAVALDGTGVLTFEERHCPNCMTKKLNNGSTLYYHPVLEAKLVAQNGFAFSMMTEFIENADLDASKQDCELKAFYRMAPRLKKRFPRLPLCILGDALFAAGPVYSICEDNDWAYIITLQDKDNPSIHEEFDSLAPLQPENKLIFHTGPQSQIRQEYRWVDDIEYQDASRQYHQLQALRCLETKKAATTKFMWVTNLTVTQNNVAHIANQGGRLRWKIENEGFNNQKNGGYELEHAYSTNPVAMKIFYFLLQIAHSIAQLMEKGSLFKAAFQKGLGSLKNIGLRLRDEWVFMRIPINLAALAAASFQIRFNSS
jgi:hypothetical protein